MMTWYRLNLRVFLMTLVISLLCAISIQAQSDEALLTWRLSRDFGYGGFAGDIQGTFSFRVEGPEDLGRVEFYIDDQEIAAITEPPWRHQFNTDDFALGVHRLSVKGYTASGKELAGDEVIREFVPARQGWQMAARIAIPLVLLSLGIPLVMYVIDRRRSARTGHKGYGPWGAAVCPKCGKPYGRHLWAPNLGVGKYDRCPHCGKWSMAPRATAGELQQAEALLASDAVDVGGPVEEGAEDRLRRQVEESRYNDL